MKAAPAARMTNRRQEAGRFAREALFWRRHRQLPQALGSLEAALAIDAAEHSRPGGGHRNLLLRRRGNAGTRAVPSAPAQDLRQPGDDRRFAGPGERGMKMMETAVQRHAAEHRPVLAQNLNPVPNIDGSFRIQEPLGGMFFVELYLERLPLVEDWTTGDGLPLPRCNGDTAKCARHWTRGPTRRSAIGRLSFAIPIG